MQDLGVKIERGRSLSMQDLTVTKLKEQGYDAVFIGIGVPDAKRITIFESLTEQMGFYTSKDFLPKVSASSKPGSHTLALSACLACNLLSCF